MRPDVRADGCRVDVAEASTASSSGHVRVGVVDSVSRGSSHAAASNGVLLAAGDDDAAPPNQVLGAFDGELPHRRAPSRGLCESSWTSGAKSLAGSARSVSARSVSARSVSARSVSPRSVVRRALRRSAPVRSVSSRSAAPPVSHAGRFLVDHVLGLTFPLVVDLLAQVGKAFSLAHSLVTHVGDSFAFSDEIFPIIGVVKTPQNVALALVGHPLALIGRPIALIRQPLTFVGCLLAVIGELVSFVRRAFALTASDIGQHTMDLADDPTHLGGVVALLGRTFAVTGGISAPIRRKQHLLRRLDLGQCTGVLVVGGRTQIGQACLELLGANRQLVRLFAFFSDPFEKIDKAPVYNRSHHTTVRRRQHPPVHYVSSVQRGLPGRRGSRSADGRGWPAGRLPRGPALPAPRPQAVAFPSSLRVQLHRGERSGQVRSTGEYDGMIAETITVRGHDGDYINAYYARPTGPGPWPSVVLFHHRPGWDEWYKEATRRFAHHGYVAICPDLYSRAGSGAPDDVAARVRAEGDVSDEQVVGDGLGCVSFLRAQVISTGKVAVMGSCSGGRHAYLTACHGMNVDAVVDCWGGRVVMQPNDLSDKYPVAPISLTNSLPCPLLGIFGEDDSSPSPEMVAQHEAELRRHDKTFEFHMYPGAGHGFFYYDRPANYRAEQAVDGWNKIWDFLARTLS
jgi:carboxymethylenebutenolidase